MMKDELEEKIDKDIQFDFKGFWQRLWDLLDFSRKQILRLLIFIFFLESLKLVGPYLLKIIIDLITNFNSAELAWILELIVMMFLINQGVSLLDYLTDKSILKSMADIDLTLSNRSQEKMLSLGLNYHEKENTGNKVVKIRRGVDRINDLWGNFFWDVAPTFFQIIMTMLALFWVDYRFGIIFVLFVPIFVSITLRVNKEVYPYRKTRFDLEEEASGTMAQSIININTVKSFVQEKRERRKFSRIMKRVIDIVIFEFNKLFKANLGKNLIIDLGRTLILLLGLFFVWKNFITIGSLVFVFTISEKALISLFRISRLYDRIMDSGEAVRRLHDLSLEKSTIINRKDGIIPNSLVGQIEFKDVVYAYPESSFKALDGVNFKIQSDCVTALVGPSGGGKTTVARMIYRHYDPEKGRILLDGHDLREYDLYGFRRFIAIVPQEVEIFNTSVRDNISYAKPRASLEEIRAAARIANAEEFIETLKDSYDTLVGERGIKLSGGQRQRIGIARAILANPRILIFDEATSSLDSQSERLIQEAMDKIRKGRTVIIIAHRLSTIKKADKIIVLEKGHVVEEGSHIELTRLAGGLYQKLNELQRMGDVE